MGTDGLWQFMKEQAMHPVSPFRGSVGMFCFSQAAAEAVTTAARANVGISVTES